MDSSQLIPLIKPYLGRRAKIYVDECFDSEWISSRGHFIPDFEKAFAAFTGSRHAVAVTNGTVALHLALMALGIGPGDEVIVPDLTFAATINAVIHAGATPVIVDVEAADWGMSVAAAAAAVTPRTKAIIPVHLYGYACDMAGLADLAARHGLTLIEDAAEAHGAAVSGRPVGSIGAVGTFSFYGNKILTTGEGGMCVTDDEAIYQRMLILRDHGMNRQDRYRYDVVGYNYRMTNPQAAIGLAQLEEVDEILAARDRIEGWYRDRLAGRAGVEIRPPIEGRRAVNWLFTCLVDERDAMIREMDAAGIETRPMFYPLHTMPIYRDYVRDPCQVSLGLSGRGISLPTYYGMPESYVERVCHAIVNRGAGGGRSV